MIHESSPWKENLTKDADVIDRWASKTAITARRSFTLEKKIFLAAYSMRKLAEAGKLSSSFKDRSVRCQKVPAISDCITIINNYELDRLYDFSKPSDHSINVCELCDLIIHSFVFSEILQDDLTIDAFCVTSDRQRYDGLWLVGISTFSRLMRLVANDYPSTIIQVFDCENNDWVTWSGHGQPPENIHQKFDRISHKTAAHWMRVPPNR